MKLDRREVLKSLGAGVALASAPRAWASSCSGSGSGSGSDLCTLHVPAGSTNRPSGGYKVLEIFLAGALSNRETFWIENPNTSIAWRTIDTFDPRTQDTLLPAGANTAWADWLPATGDYKQNDYELRGAPGFGTVHLGPACVPLVRPLADQSTLLQRASMVTLGHRLPVHPEAQRAMLCGGLPAGDRRTSGLGAIVARLNEERGTPAPSFVLYDSRSIQGQLAAEMASLSGGHGSRFTPIAIPVDDPTVVTRLSQSTSGATEQLVQVLQLDYAERLTFSNAPVAGERARAAAFDRYLAAWGSTRQGPTYAAALAPLSTSNAQTFWDNGTRRGLKAAAKLLQQTPARYCAVVDAGVSTYDTHFRPPEETARIHTGNLLNVLRTLHELVDDAELNLDDTLIVVTSEFGRGDQPFDRSNHWPDAFQTLLLGGPIAPSANRIHRVGELVDPDSAPRSILGAAPLPGSHGIRPADLRAAIVAATGAMPLQTGLFERSDVGRTSASTPDEDLVDDLYTTFFGS